MGRRQRPDHPDPARLSGAVDRILTVLADPQRRRAVELLGTRPWRAGELARALDLSPPTLSRHLRVMKDGGLVEESHPDFDARVRIYSLKAGAMTDLQDWLAATEAMWTAELAAFKRHVEQAPE